MSTPIRIDLSSDVDRSYRAQRVRSMFNATNEQATHFGLHADWPIDMEGDWQIGVIAGPSGSGKSSIGRALWGGGQRSTNRPAGTTGTRSWTTLPRTVASMT